MKMTIHKSQVGKDICSRWGWVGGWLALLLSLSRSPPPQLSPTLHIPFNTHISASETLLTLLLRPQLFADVLPRFPPPTPRLRLTAALSVCRGVLENTKRSLMKCFQKVTGWRRRRGREPTTEEEGGTGVKERE